MKEAWFLASPVAEPDQLPDTGWRRVALPHQWSLDPNLKGIEPEIEVGWYRLELPEVATGRRWLEIRGDYIVQAWMDGAYQGEHTGYFQPWQIEVIGRNDLFLRVAAPKEEYGRVWPRFKQQIKGVLGQHDCRPGGSTPRGQERGSGGLWGGAKYFRTGAIALLHLSWRAVPTAIGWNLWMELELDVQAPARTDPDQNSPSYQETLAFTLTPDNFQGEAYSMRQTLELTPGRSHHSLVWHLPDLPRWEVWERGFPSLYNLTVRSEKGKQGERPFTCQVGFRTIDQDGDWVRLNDQRLFLRGTNIIPTQWLAGYTAEDAQRDVRLLKEAHLNAVRVHAHLTHPLFYQACDREGILVWQDFPLQWGYATDETFAQNAVCQAQEMVKYYGNFVSIYLWCAHNEPTHNRYSLDPLLAAAISQADSTRLVKEASNFREHPYPGWYWGHLRDFMAIPRAPLPSEFGAQGLPRAELLKKVLGEAAWPPQFETWVFHNFQPDQTFRVAGIEMGESLEEFVANSQEYQARLVKFAIETYRRAKGRVTGYFHFMFVEPWEGITWAVVDVEREPKKGYFALKEASAPILLSFEPFRDELEIGQAPLSEAWIINDLPRDLNLRVQLRLEGPVIVRLFEDQAVVPGQGSTCVFQIGDFYEASTSGDKYGQLAAALRTQPPGDYRLVGEAWEGEVLLSRNEIPVRYLPPMVSLGEGW